MSSLFILAAGIALFPLAAQSAETHTGGTPASGDSISISPGAESATQAPGADKPDKQTVQSGAKTLLSGEKFATKAAQGGMTEVALGKLAGQKASLPAVKEFGRMMVADHTKIGEKLESIALIEKIEVPDSLDSAHQKAVNKLAGLQGAAFDEAYVESMVNDHEKTIALFKEASANCTNAELKAFASATLPMLNMHFNRILTIQKQLP